MEFKHKLDLPNIAGNALQLIHQMARQYQQAGHCDPLLYRALRVAGELADQLKDRATEDEAPESVLEELSDFANSIYYTAMEIGEEVRKVLEENGLPLDIMTGNVVEHEDGCDCDRLDNDGEQ